MTMVTGLHKGQVKPIGILILLGNVHHVFNITSFMDYLIWPSQEACEKFVG